MEEADKQAALEAALVNGQEATLALIEVKLDCLYNKEELKSIDRLLFNKYKVPELGLLYACISTLVCATPAIICYLFNQAEAARVLNLSMQWSPAIIPLCILHTLYVYRIRMKNVDASLKNDNPVIIDLNQNNCLVTSAKVEPAAQRTSTYSWDRFAACLSTADHYICLHPTGPVIIQKRLLTDPVQSACVQLLLRLKIRNYQEIST